MITITETLYKKMPDDIKSCFNQLPNPSSEEVRECFPETKGGGSQNGSRKWKGEDGEGGFGGWAGKVSTDHYISRDDGTGNASRFFKSIIYQAKASKSERNKGCEGLPLGEPPASARSKPAEGRENALGNPRANNHPTVKPIALMEYLIKMVTPKGGIVLDPFAGSGSTLVAAKENGFGFVGIELTADYIPIIEARTGVKADLIEIDNPQNIVRYLIRENKPLPPLQGGMSCTCGGKIIKTANGLRTCQDCFTDY